MSRPGKWSQGFDFMVANDVSDGVVEGLQAYDWLRSLVVDMMQDLSFDEILRSLIMDADLEEIVCCLDIIASEQDKEVKLFEGDKQIYPVEA